MSTSLVKQQLSMKSYFLYHFLAYNTWIKSLELSLVQENKAKLIQTMTCDELASSDVCCFFYLLSDSSSWTYHGQT